MERLDHLKELLAFLKKSEGNEAAFDEVYKRLFNENKLEVARLDDLELNEYLNNIRQTIDKQAGGYIRSKSGSASERKEEYRTLIYNFIQDVEEEISNINRA